MIYSIFITCLIICLIGLISNGQRNFLKYILLGLVAYLLGRGAINPDSFNYYYKYLNAQELNFADTYEPGYLLIQKISYFSGVDFIQFQILFAFISLILIDSVVKKLSYRATYIFFVFYLSFFVFIDSVQIRSFYSFSLIVVGFGYLFIDDVKSNKLAFIIFFILGVSIHISMIVFLPFIILSINDKNIVEKISKIIAMFSISFCIVVFFQGNILELFKTIISFITNNSERTRDYGVNAVRLGFLYPFMMHFFSVVILFILKRLSLKYNYSTRTCTLIDRFLVFNLIAFFCLPLYMFNLQFIRVARELLLVNFMFFSYLIGNIKFNQRGGFYSFVVMGSLTILLFCYTFIIGDHIDDILIPFFDNKNIVQYVNG
ncbi:TPA: EpsG family protein [Photobacterium damselae]